MSNTIVVTGYVGNLKKYDKNDDAGNYKGSSLLFTISSKTNDPKRWNEQNNNRDFFSVDLFVPASRANLLNFIQEGKVMSVTGIPYQSMGNDGNQRYHNIKTYPDLISFIPTGGNSENNQNQNQNQNQAQNQGNKGTQQQSNNQQQNNQNQNQNQNQGQGNGNGPGW